MKKISILLTLLGILVCTLIKAGIAENGILHTKGHDIVDARGQKIHLRGVGLGNWFLPEGYMWKFGPQGDRPRRMEKMFIELIGKDKADEFWTEFYDTFITERDIALIAEMGFNSVRPALNSRLFIEEDAQETVFKDQGFRYLDQLISWCREYNLYVIIDLHGAPGGQTGANIDDSKNDKPELFLDPKNQQRTIDLWTEIARRYTSEPVVAGYDLLNEPLPAHFSQYNHLLFPLYKKITAAIRKVDQQHMITLEGANWASDWTALQEPFDDNLFYQFHKYWNAIDKSSIQPYLDYQKKWNVPIWVGETGENRNDWYWPSMQLLDEYNIGWSFWPWKKLDAENGCVSISMPQGWEKITAYSEGGAKPSAEETWTILQKYLKNLKLERCTVNTQVIRSIFRRIPGKIEAEHFGHLGEGISYHLQNPEDTESPLENYNVSWLSPDEWLEYELECPESDTFDILVRTATEKDGRRFYLKLDGNRITDPITVPNSGGWQSWSIVQISDVKIPKGNHQLRFQCIDGDFNFDWISINPSGQTGAYQARPNHQMAEGKRGLIPGIIQAEFYGRGGEGVSYHDSDSENKPGQFRKDGVDLEKTADSDPFSSVYRAADPVPVHLSALNCNVGWIEAGEWMEYTVHCEKKGTYDILFRTASPNHGKHFTLKVNGKKVSKGIEAPYTGSWQKYETVRIEGISLKKGKTRLRFISLDGGFNLDWISVQSPGQDSLFVRPENNTMLKGQPGLIPGLIEAEHYGADGPGISYMDHDAQNQGDPYRTDGVDLEYSSKHYSVSMKKNEWFVYEANVLNAFQGKLKLSAEGGPDGFAVQVLIDGKKAGQSIQFSPENSAVLEGPALDLKPGKHILTLKVIEGSGSVDWMEIRQ